MIYVNGKKIIQTDETYFIKDILRGSIEIDANTIAIAFRLRDYISFIDRRLKRLVKKITIPLFSKWCLNLNEL
jgi:hypothetical protein